ncbi:glycerol-3-phosphate acyltransferase 4 isoform X3 [Wyeomyia smithii]|uniref:glycerol-3-phosphate acyltransferase 4 isoform X3 n=1 Tax=Wyeomyia smithii TaxID=174621 RepID=UPI002467DA53|nr:glycerol-3-phosphate acyltransferase 4 isoform X3 [Wyeomyia smithii]
MFLLSLINIVLSMITMTSVLTLLFFIIFLASMGKSIGVRRKYVELLVKIFEYGRQNIESIRKQQYDHLNTSDDSDLLINTESDVSLTDDAKSKTEITQNRNVEKAPSNGINLVNGGNSVINRVESLKLLPDVEGVRNKNRELNNEEENGSLEFNLSNCLDYVKTGMEAIIEDEVTSRFEAEELKNWNLLTRTNRHYEFISWRLTVIWVIGFFIRYVILMPSRVFICFIGIGQRHGGFLGVLQRALARASPHIWFERAEAKDRMAVAKRLKEHVSDPNNPPILIFPEGTCINNTSVMQFKKGSFEVGGTIYPVAIKYDARFGDAFWNSSRYSMMQYLYMMMTSWAIVCDVWYLPAMTRSENESAIDFANRVKSVIAKQGGLVDLVWDGQLKRMKPKKEWKEKQQEEFTKRLKGE